MKRKKFAISYNPNPDQINGIERLTQVYEAHGEKRKAAEYYRKAADFAKSMEGFDQKSID